MMYSLFMKKISLVLVSIVLSFSFMVSTSSAASHSPTSSYCKAKTKKFADSLRDYTFYYNLYKNTSSKKNKSFYKTQYKKYADIAGNQFKEGRKDCGPTFGDKLVIKLS